MSLMHNDKSRCTARWPHTGQDQCPARHECERWLAYRRDVMSPEFKVMTVMHPPLSALPHGGDWEWECPHFIQRVDESA